MLYYEVSHALTGHGNERISQAMIAQYGGAIAGGVFRMINYNKFFKVAYPIGAQVALLKYEEVKN